MDYSVILMGNLYEALIKRNTLAVEFLDFLIIQNILGTINFRLKNSLEAITNYNKAIELKPDYAELYNNLRTALRHYKTKSFSSQLANNYLKTSVSEFYIHLSKISLSNRSALF